MQQKLKKLLLVKSKNLTNVLLNHRLVRERQSKDRGEVIHVIVFLYILRKGWEKLRKCKECLQKFKKSISLKIVSKNEFIMI